MKNTPYKHFVLTRFNLVLTQFKQDKSGNNIHTDEWLKKRFELFDWFCFPSLANQTNTDFKWLVLFSKYTPDSYKQKIDGYAKAFPNFVPCYLEDGENPFTRVRTEIDKLLTGQETHVITSRIDNDDSFHEDAVKLIQQQFNNQDDQLLNFDNGLQYDMDNKVLCEFTYKNNPFISRIEKITDQGFKTIYEKRHNFVNELGNIKYIQTHPTWLQIIHDGNLSNSLRINMLVFNPGVLKQFNITYQAQVSKANSLKMFVKYNKLFLKIKKKGGRVFKLIKNKLKG